MNNRFSRIFFVLFVLTMALSACGNNTPKTDASPTETTKEEYKCPMKCTEQTFDKPGKCPVCEMELEKVTNS